MPARTNLQSPVVVVLLVALTGLLVATPAGACSTCFGAVDSAATRGMNGAILTMLGFVAVVQVGFVALFASFLARSRRARRRHERIRMIRGGSS